MKKRSTLQVSEEQVHAKVHELLTQRFRKKTIREFEEILGAEFISVTGGVLAGAMLGQMVGELAKHPGILILLPGFLAMRGNIAGSLAARLSAALHLKIIDGKNDHVTQANVWAASALSLIISAFLGVVAYASTLLFFHANTV